MFASAHRGLSPGLRLVLRRARLRQGPESDVAIEGGRVAEIGPSGSLPRVEAEADLGGRFLLPGLVNAHDVLDTAALPALGRPPYPDLYDWISASARAGSDHTEAMSLSLPDLLFLGGLRNLLAGVTAVVHHNPDHRSLGRDDFPVRVLRRYGFAHSPGVTPKLRQAYRTTDRRIPWFVRAAAGTGGRAAAELDTLADANVLRQNTVIVHGTALREGDAPRLAAAGASVVWCPEVGERLFGAQPPVAALLHAGVPLGLGSGGAAEGGRDLLSALACARRTGLLADDALLELASVGSAQVSRLPLGGLIPGAPADFLVTPSAEALLTGSRAAVHLVLVAGRPLWGEPNLLRTLVPRQEAVEIDGVERALSGRSRRGCARCARASGGPRFRSG